MKPDVEVQGLLIGLLAWADVSLTPNGLPEKITVPT